MSLNVKTISRLDFFFFPFYFEIPGCPRCLLEASLGYVRVSLEREPGRRISISRSLPAQTRGFPGGTSGKEPACQCRLDIRDNSSISGSGKSLGEGNGNPLQYSCLENPMDRAAWRATVHGVAQSWTQLK